MADPCDEGLTPECFKAHPQWARQAFAYRLLHTLVPKRLSKNLPRAFRIPLPFPGVSIPIDANFPPGTIIGPGSTFLLGWQPGDPLPDGVFFGSMSDLPVGWQPGDPIPQGIIDPSMFPPGFDIEGWFSNLSTDFFPPGPPGPPGATSKGGATGISPGVDITDDNLAGAGASGYVAGGTSGAMVFDNDFETRLWWKKPTELGGNDSTVDPILDAPGFNINGLRVKDLYNETGETWTFGVFNPAWTPLIATVKNCTGWSDVYLFEGPGLETQYRLKANDDLIHQDQESWLYEMELYAF